MKAKVDQETDKGNGPRDHPIIVALIGAGGVVAAALITVFSLHGGPAPVNSSSAGSHVSVASKPSGKPHAQPSATSHIISPKKGGLLRGDESVLVDGSATHLGGESFWVFVRRYGIYYVSDTEAIPVIDGRWRFRDPYIGSSSNTGRFQIDAVIANASCVLAINSAKQQPGGGVAFKSLPLGCRILDDVDVKRV